MYKLCKTEQSALRQRQIEEGLLAVMMVKRYEEITVSDLCGQVGVPRKSFYRYFSGKDGALHGLIDHTLLDFEQSTGLLSGAHVHNEQMGLEHFFRFWLQQKPLLDALKKSGLSGVLVERAIHQAQSGYMDSGARYVQPIHRHAITFGICGLMSMATGWHHEGYQESVENMTRMAAELLSKPLLEMSRRE